MIPTKAFARMRHAGVLIVKVLRRKARLQKKQSSERMSVQRLVVNVSAFLLFGMLDGTQRTWCTLLQCAGHRKAS